MKTQLVKLRETLEKMKCRAEELSDSEIESTAERYEAVAEILQGVVDGIEEALDVLGVMA